MKVKALVAFYDLEAKGERKEGEVFTCSDERAAHLIGIGYVEKCREKAVERPVSVSKAVSEKE